jgi:protein-S-isoprenylcysteine O-methyltransferase Ste14
MGFVYLEDVSALSLILMIAGAVLCLASYALRVAYHVVRYRRDREVVGFRASIVLIFLGYFGWGYWSAADPVKMAIPRPVALAVGIPLTAAGLALFILSEAKHRGSEADAFLITTGIYARIRHPMYVGLVLLHYGYPLIFRSFAAFLSTHIWIAFIIVWTGFEEKRLERTFGERYREYKRSTWF